MRLAPAAVLLAVLVLFASCDSAEDPADDTIEITVLVAYTPSVAELVEDVAAHMRRGFDETNAVYANSGTGARLAVAHLVGVDYEVEDRLEALAHLLRPDDGPLDELHTLRDEHEADVVLLVSGTPGSTINATVMAVPETAFLIVHWEVLGAPFYGLAHEMGHLHGARHALADDPTLEPFPWGHGFRGEDFRTVMTWGPQTLVPVFSGPSQVHEGVALGDSTRHDVARVVRETAAYLSNFRGPQTPTDFEPPGTWPVLPDL